MNVEANGHLLRRNWLPIGASVALAALGLVLGRSADLQVSLGGYLGAWFGFVLAPLFYFRNAFPRSTPTTFRATAAGISVAGYGDVQSEDILEAKVVPRNGPEAVVELALRDKRTLSLRTHAHHAKALVDVLGARRTRFRLVAPYGKRLLATFAILSIAAFLVDGAQLDVTLSLIPGLLFYSLILAWLAGYVRGRLVVGADGFTTRWLWRERFVAFRDVAAVNGRSRWAAGVEDTIVLLKSGRKRRLRTVEAPNTDEERGAESRAMLAHLLAAFQQSVRLLDGSVDVRSLVERGARSPREWLSGIDALVRGGGSRYRVAAVSADMLAELANDPNAKPEARVGAAAALVRMGDDSLRTRVRISAEACAEPELRETLLAVSEARDDVAAEAALATMRR